MKYGRELVENIGHCLFFTETNCTWKCFVLLSAVRRFDHSEVLAGSGDSTPALFSFSNVSFHFSLRTSSERQTDDWLHI